MDLPVSARKLILTAAALVALAAPAAQGANIQADRDAAVRMGASLVGQQNLSTSLSKASNVAAYRDAAVRASGVPSIMSMTPAQLAAKTSGRPALESVLSSMSPKTRRFTEAIMSLTFAQLAMGAAGSP